MADIKSTLTFQDRMSSILNNISRRLNDASTSADLAKNRIKTLENAQRTVRDEIRKYNETVEQTNNQNRRMALGFESVQGKIVTLSAAFQLFNQAKAFIQGLNSKINEFVEYTKTQMQAEDQLAIITKQRMALTDNEVRSLYELAAAQQRVGVVGDEATIAGMTGLAAFTKQKSAIQALTPALDDLAVKMYGYNVTAESMDMISKSLGKAMLGDVGALSRMGIKIDDVTKKRLMSLREEERAIELAKLIKNVTGDMNEEMAKTPFGQIAQANNRLGDSYERLGATLLPLQATLTQVWSEIVEKVINNLDIIAPAIITALSVISAGFITMKWEAITAWLAAIAPVATVIAGIAAVSMTLNALGISFREQVENMLISFNWIITGIQNVGIMFENVWKFITTATSLAVSGWKMIFAKYFEFVLGNFEIMARVIDKIFKTDISSGITNLKKSVQNFEKETKDNARGKIDNFQTKQFLDNSLYANQTKARNFMGNFKGNALTNRALLGNTGNTNDKNNKTGTGLEGLTTNTSGGKALKTQNQGKLEFSEDNMELLHDLATQKYAQYFQQLTPNLTIPSMVIHETADVNQVIGAVASAITGSVTSSTSGGFATA